MYPEIQIVPPQAGFPEQRRWARYRARIVACVIAQKQKKAVIVSGHGSELNHGGMTVFAGIELAINDQIKIIFTPPYGGEPLTFQCVVRDRNGYTYGVEFIRDANDGEQISQMQRILDALEKLNRR